ncbi:MAG: hypothetical protein QOC94_4888 [Actinoplanes sp.]|nr:hypothetical protein [Actinoplanes sp.]
MRRRIAALSAVLLVLVAAFLVPGVSAVFTALTASGAGTLTTAATFPTYTAAVAADTPTFYHRLEEASSSSATSAAADSSGNAKPATYSGATSGACPWYRFDTTTGTYADSSGCENPVTFNAPATTGTGIFGNALATGTGSAQTARAPVSTNADFSIATWVKLPSATLGSNKTLIATAGTHTSAFIIQANSSTSTWTVTMPDSDTAGATSQLLDSGVTVVTSWTQVTLTYTASTRSASIAVDGVVMASKTRTANWAATQVTSLGRAWISDAWAQQASLSLDEVRFYPRVLTNAQVEAVYDAPIKTGYSFLETSGTTAADVSLFGHTGTLGTGASWVTGNPNNAVGLDGTANGYVTAASALDTTQSLSVSAYVKLTSTGSNRVIVTQKGSAVPGYSLRYNGSPSRWEFAMYRSDSTAATEDVVFATATVVTGTWTHVAGVFDAGTGVLSIYVKGKLGGVTATHPSTFAATGTTEIGRSWYNSAYSGENWLGSVDNVRLRQVAMSASAAYALYLDDDFAPPPIWPMTAGIAGALQGSQQGLQSDTAVAFAGGTSLYNNFQFNNPNPFTVECWFRISSYESSVLFAFGDKTSGPTATRDRTVWIDSAGRLDYGVYTASTSTFHQVRSALTYNDATWHHVAATVGPAGQELYADGVLVASDATSTNAQGGLGYWRLGGVISLANWSFPPTNDYLTGALDEFAVYPSQLTAQQIAWHYHANH